MSRMETKGMHMWALDFIPSTCDEGEIDKWYEV